jgi:hypothetical protein
MADEFTVATSLVDQMTAIGITVVSGLLAWGAAEFSRWIRTKTSNEKILQALDNASALVESTVNEANVTLMAGVREAAQDGVISKEEALKVKNKVLSQVKDNLPPKATALIVANLGDLDLYLGGQIEKKVVEAKAEATMTNIPT